MIDIIQLLLARRGNCHGYRSIFPASAEPAFNGEISDAWGVSVYNLHYLGIKLYVSWAKRFNRELAWKIEKRITLFHDFWNEYL